MRTTAGFLPRMIETVKFSVPRDSALLERLVSLSLPCSKHFPVF